MTTRIIALKSITTLTLGALIATWASVSIAEPTLRSDALLGKWQSDPSVSTFKGAIPYKSATYTFKRKEDGLHVSSEIFEANIVLRFNYVDLEDGTFVPVTGNPFYDSESTTWKDELTAVRTERRESTITGTTTFTVAPDLQSYSATASRTLPTGGLYTSVIVWKRIED